MNTPLILAGDIGGTKTLLCLGYMDHGSFRSLAKKRYDSAGYANFEDVLADFLAETDTLITAACFGVAGAVVAGVCRTTNLPWVLDEKELCRHLGGAKVKLLNDLEATAFGILHLPERDCIELNPAASSRSGAHQAVIAAGTGLGEALIIQTGKTETIVATEGGHCDFAPIDDQQGYLLAWLRKKYPEHVSYERILSGPGLVNIYHFLVQQDRDRENIEVAAAMAQSDAAAVIGEWGEAERDQLCHRALQLFSRIYGAEAGNLVLKSLALGGVYVAGGIAPKILQVLQQGNFMDGFTTKGRFADLLKKVPVRVVMNTEVVLLGAFNWCAKRMLHG